MGDPKIGFQKNIYPKKINVFQLRCRRIIKLRPPTPQKVTPSLNDQIFSDALHELFQVSNFFYKSPKILANNFDCWPFELVLFLGTLLNPHPIPKSPSVYQTVPTEGREVYGHNFFKYKECFGCLLCLRPVFFCEKRHADDIPCLNLSFSVIWVTRWGIFRGGSKNATDFNIYLGCFLCVFSFRKTQTNKQFFPDNSYFTLEKSFDKTRKPFTFSSPKKPLFSNTLFCCFKKPTASTTQTAWNHWQKLKVIGMKMRHPEGGGVLDSSGWGSGRSGSYSKFWVQSQISNFE